jgi:hypothetical protein
MPRIAAMYTYPWDVVDEGIGPAIRRLKEVAGQNEVHLATSYHISTYFLPHNPRRTIYYGEDGMVLYQPEARRYERLKIKPRVSEVVTGPGYYEQVVRALREAGLGYGAWMVYAYNHHLARTHPECARQDALGNRYLAQLCVANPDVRDYFRVLTEEVLDRFRPTAVHLESLSYLPFAYGFMNPKVFMEIAPRDEFLLGLCFCEHCKRAASRSGMDGDRFRAAVAEHLTRSLARDPKPEEKLPPDREWQDQAFDGRLAHYLAARVESATSLYEQVAGLCRERKAAVQDTWAPEGSEAVSGLDPRRKHARCDRFALFTRPTAAEVANWKRQAPGKQFLWSVQPVDTTPELPQRCADAVKDGIDGFTFYNYGLLREQRLANIGAARGVWS